MSFLEKPNNIWIAIATIIVSFAVSLAFLQAGRQVNAEDIQELKATYQTINIKLDKMNDKLNEATVTQAQIKTDIDYIKRAIIVVQEK